jgi:hypothetical protein
MQRHELDRNAKKGLDIQNHTKNVNLRLGTDNLILFLENHNHTEQAYKRNFSFLPFPLYTYILSSVLWKNQCSLISHVWRMK